MAVCETPQKLIRVMFYLCCSQVYYHGETIPIKVKVKNDTNKVVNKFKITGELNFVHTHMHLFFLYNLMISINKIDKIYNKCVFSCS